MDGQDRQPRMQDQDSMTQTAKVGDDDGRDMQKIQIMRDKRIEYLTQLKVKKSKRDNLKNVVFSSCDSATMSSSLTDEDKKHLENFKKFFSLFCSHKNFLDEKAVGIVYCGDGVVDPDKDPIEYIESTLVAISNHRNIIGAYENMLDGEIDSNTMGEINSIIKEVDNTIAEINRIIGK